MDSMDSLVSGSLKPRLLALVAQGMAEQQAFIAQLSDAQRAAVGAPDAWAAKDHIAHNAAWKTETVRIIAAAVRGETPTPSPDDTEFNPQVFTAQQHQPWEAILADATQADSALRTVLEACSEANLSDPARFAWRNGYPLWYRAFVSGYEHPAEHYGQFYLESGNVVRARTVRQEAFETARRYVGGTEPFGYMAYNVGSFYAQIGQRDLALDALREAFVILPRLREWSRKDPELASLHDDPSFQSLATDGSLR